jgi:dTDP-4-amino-4,6-dideoxygalactose transaminase
MHKLESWPKFSQEEIAIVKKVLSSGQVNYWTGKQGKEFEKEFSDWTGAKHSIALANGTVALDLALIALGIGKKDEVIVTPRSFIASVSSVVNVGAKPVFSDIDIGTGNITAEHIEKKISKRTKAIICVHLGGLPCEMDEIMKLAKRHGLYVIEDCAQAHGAKYRGISVGTIGDVGAWSFCQDKIMTTGGEGGMVTTNSEQLWEKMWSYKDHGKNYESVNIPSTKPGFKWIHDSIGSNFRMTEMQASIGRIQIKKMKVWNRLRNRNAMEIIKMLNSFPQIVTVYSTPNYMNHAFYRIYVSVKLENLKKSWTRDRVIKEINANGVPCFSGSCPEIYNEKAIKSSGFSPKKRLPNAKLLGENSLAFLCHPTLQLEDLKFMNKTIKSVLLQASELTHVNCNK